MDDNIPQKKTVSPLFYAFMALATVAIVSLAVKGGSDAPPAAGQDITMTDPATPEASAPDQAAAIDPGVITAWQKAAAERDIDLSLYDVVYVQDSRSISVLLAHKQSPEGLRGSAQGAPNYEIIVERGSNRVLNMYVAR